MINVVILGCGASAGVPEIGCNCYVCTSPNEKNKRTRTSILVYSDKTQILVDTGPDLRMQALKNDIHTIDAVLYTHAHSDHVNGIDELKLMRKHAVIPAYMDKYTHDALDHRFNYAFAKPTNNIYKPFIEANIINPYSCFKINDIEVQAFEQVHYDIKTLGFRFGDIAYSTDLSFLSEKSIDILYGIKYWIIDCVRYSWAPTHLYLEKVMQYLYKVKPERAILVHMSHQIEYSEIFNILPNWVVPAFDGMRFGGAH